MDPPELTPVIPHASDLEADEVGSREGLQTGTISDLNVRRVAMLQSKTPSLSSALYRLLRIYTRFESLTALAGINRQLVHDLVP